VEGREAVVIHLIPVSAPSWWDRERLRLGDRRQWHPQRDVVTSIGADHLFDCTEEVIAKIASA
jgi:hypothetical protein